MSPMELTLRELRATGWQPEKTEHWNPFAKRRNDLFGFIDVLAISKAHGWVIAIQCTSDSHVAERVTKIKEHPNWEFVKKTGWKVEVWGWKKKKNRYVNRIVEVK